MANQLCCEELHLHHGNMRPNTVRLQEGSAKNGYQWETKQGQQKSDNDPANLQKSKICSQSGDLESSNSKKLSWKVREWSLKVYGKFSIQYEIDILLVNLESSRFAGIAQAHEWPHQLVGSIMEIYSTLIIWNKTSSWWKLQQNRFFMTTPKRLKS